MIYEAIVDPRDNGRGKGRDDAGRGYYRREG